LFFLVGFGSFGCSKGSKADVIKGKIVSVDNSKNEIVIKDNKTGTEKTISVNPNDISSLKTNEEVRVKLASGTNKAESIKLRSQRNKDE
jgi:Na+-translocating ferredoxin:NAD+ oxidoreductase RNF subunit RnfB